MATVSDELVERVARRMFEFHYGGLVWDNETNALRESYRDHARAAIAALSTPEFVLPRAEEMLRGANARIMNFMPGKAGLDCLRMRLTGGQQTGPGMRYIDGDTLLDAYLEARGK